MIVHTATYDIWLKANKPTIVLGKSWTTALVCILSILKELGTLDLAPLLLASCYCIFLTMSVLSSGTINLGEEKALACTCAYTLKPDWVQHNTFLLQFTVQTIQFWEHLFLPCELEKTWLHKTSTFFVIILNQYIVYTTWMYCILSILFYTNTLQVLLLD